jgi:hypothetical protein
MYTFHEAVNTRLEKPSFPFSSLAETYKSTAELSKWMKDLNEMTMRAMKLNGMQLKPWENWINQLKMVKAAMCI